jgi:hypothetical protein
MALDPRAYQVIDGGGAQAMQRDLSKAMETGAAIPRAKGTA